MTLQQLGLATDRAVIPHVDDLGTSHAANAAFLQLAAGGRVACGAVIVPGPWFREIAEAAQADPGLDIGVHLCLTSEWDRCRWAPLSTTSRASGLVDEDGYFPRDLDALRGGLVVEAAEAEFRAQVERAIAAGVAPTHLDSHMGASMLPELLPVHVRLAREYGLVPILPRGLRWPMLGESYVEAVEALVAEGAPMPDGFRGTLPVPEAELDERWRTLMADLPPGLTHLALHATLPSEEFAAMSPQHAPWRFAEFRWLERGGLAELCAAKGVAMTSTRALQRLWAKVIAASAP